MHVYFCHNVPYFQLYPVCKVLLAMSLFAKFERLCLQARQILMTPTTSHDRTFPPTRPIIPGLDYFGDRRTAQSVNRDYIDYFATGQGNLGLAVGDVSGKEVSAALLGSSMRSMTRALRAMRSLSLKTLMRTVDKLFSRISPDKCYATLFLGEYDPTSGRLRYVNAGHEPPFVLAVFLAPYLER